MYGSQYFWWQNIDNWNGMAWSINAEYVDIPVFHAVFIIVWTIFWAAALFMGVPSTGIHVLIRSHLIFFAMSASKHFATDVPDCDKLVIWILIGVADIRGQTRLRHFRYTLLLSAVIFSHLHCFRLKQPFKPIIASYTAKSLLGS